MTSYSKNKLPIIDLSSKVLKPNTALWESTCNNIRSALEEYGTFTIIYDDISQESHDKIFNLSNDLFNLPTETKVKNTSDTLGFGYGGNFSNFAAEYFGIEGGSTVEGTQKFTNALWPNGNDVFFETALSYSKRLRGLGELVIKMLFESYGTEKYFEYICESIHYLMRFLKYQLPPSTALESSTEKKLGLHSHTDKGFWAILDQNHICGLEIQTKAGDWIAFEPSPSTFVFMTGDAILAWSNGRICPPPHRVIVSAATELKYTIGLIGFGNAIVTTPDELADDEQVIKFKPFHPMLYLKYCMQEKIYAENGIIQYCGI